MSRGRIVKASRVQLAGLSGTPVVAEGEDIAVHIHREGALVSSLDVRCSCGRAKSFDVMYDAPALANDAGAQPSFASIQSTPAVPAELSGAPLPSGGGAHGHPASPGGQPS